MRQHSWSKQTGKRIGKDFVEYVCTRCKRSVQVYRGRRTVAERLPSHKDGIYEIDTTPRPLPTWDPGPRKMSLAEDCDVEIVRQVIEC